MVNGRLGLFVTMPYPLVQGKRIFRTIVLLMQIRAVCAQQVQAGGRKEEGFG